MSSTTIAAPSRRLALLAGTAFAALLFHGPALAAEIEAKSRIEAVTVYPDGAIVNRRVDIDLPQGATLLVFKGLPLAIDPASLRVEGQASGALTLGAIEARLTPVDPGRPTGANDEQLRALRLEREKLAVDLESIEGRKAMIQRFAQAGPERQGEPGRGLDVEKWAQAWEAVGSALGKVNEDLRKARLAIRETEEKIRAIEAADAARRPRSAPEREFTLALEAGQALKGSLSLSYRVNGASWRPAYDAHLDTGEGGKAAGLRLTRRALVTQRTGEDWSDVALTLSTVRAARGTAAPDLQPLRVSFYEPAPPIAVQTQRPRSMAAESALEAARRQEAPAAPAPVGGAAPKQDLRVAEASLETNGFEASYRIPGVISVPKDGAQKSFAIQTRTLQPEMLVRAAPVVDATAYLEASFVNAEEAPLLAGEVTLIRDNAFIGRGRLAFIAPGDKATLGFGADDRVKVTRVPVRRRETEPSLLGSAKTDTREFRTVVRNLHSFPIRTTIVDQLPFSENASLTVELLPNATPATEKIVQDKRGVMAWTLDLKAGEEKDIRFGYRLRWPSDRELTFESQPLPR